MVCPLMTHLRHWLCTAALSKTPSGALLCTPIWTYSCALGTLRSVAWGCRVASYQTYVVVAWCGDGRGAGRVCLFCLAGPQLRQSPRTHRLKAAGGAVRNVVGIRCGAIS